MATDLADIFGKPRAGVHAARIPGLDIAFWDTVGTVIVAVVLAFVFRQSAWRWLLLLCVLGFVAHLAFGVRTKLVTAAGSVVHA